MFVVKVSLTSSCEIVDALEEAANDVAEEVRNDSKEASPAEEVSWMGDSSMPWWWPKVNASSLYVGTFLPLSKKGK